MGEAAVGVLLLVVALAIGARGLPVVAAALEGRRIEAAVRHRDGRALRRAVAGAAGLAELGRVLRQLQTAELLALGGGIAADAGDERGAQILAAIAEAVERRDLALERWARVLARRPELPAPGTPGKGAP
jgi:hypothetical protein